MLPDSSLHIADDGERPSIKLRLHLYSRVWWRVSSFRLTCMVKIEHLDLAGDLREGFRMVCKHLYSSSHRRGGVFLRKQWRTLRRAAELKNTRQAYLRFPTPPQRGKGCVVNTQPFYPNIIGVSVQKSTALWSKLNNPFDTAQRAKFVGFPPGPPIAGSLRPRNIPLSGT
jgi:hypothetical protein